MYLDWKKREHELVDMYYNQHLSTKDIAKKYNVAGVTISQNMRRMGYQLRHVGKERVNAKYKVNSNFFHKIETEEQAYVLGFFLTDGHLSKSGNLMFTLHQQDRDILEQINTALQSTYQIYPCRDKYVSLVITDQIITQDLRHMGFTNHKTFDTNIQDVIRFVDPSVMAHFIRGMFDGDGSIQYYKYPYIKKHQFHFGYTGLLNVVQFVYQFLNLHTQLTQETDVIYTCTTKCIADIIRIKSILYTDATIFCHRKYQIFQEIQNIYQQEFC